MAEGLADALEKAARIAEGLRTESERLSTEREIRAAQARWKRQLDEVLPLMRTLPPEEKKRLGQATNQLKGELEEIVVRRLAGLAQAARAADLERDVDVT